MLDEIWLWLAIVKCLCNLFLIINMLSYAQDECFFFYYYINSYSKGQFWILFLSLIQIQFTLGI